MRNDLVLVRGAGRIGTAVAHRLRLCGFPVVMTEAARPTLIHRLACFGSAIDRSEVTVEGVTARRASGAEGVRQILEDGAVPVLVDPSASIRESMTPWVLIDATGLDRNVGTRRSDAPIVLGIGPGFVAGEDVHAVVDSRPSADLGRFTTEGALRPGPPAARFTEASGLVVSAGVGRFESRTLIGRAVEAGALLGAVGGQAVTAPRAGVVAGLLADGLFVGLGIRLADVDDRNDPSLVASIDPLARAVAGGVLEALLYTAAVGTDPGQALPVRAE